MGEGKAAKTTNKNTAGPARRQPKFSKEHQSYAGKMLVAKRGRAYMAEIGRRGYATTIARYPNFHLQGGKAAWHKQNRDMLDQDYFANQSLEQWNYCQYQGCHRQKLAESSYCSQHSRLAPSIPS